MTDQELYDKFKGFAYGVALKMRRSYKLTQEDVEDIAASSLTLLLAQRKKIDFSEPCQAHSYCYTIITNAARTALLKLRDYKDFVSLDEPIGDDEGSEGSRYDYFPDARADIEGALLAKESRRQARQYLKQRWHKITPEYRMLVTRRFGLDGNTPISFRDLAAELGVSAKVVRYKVNNALKKLRSNRR